MGSNSPKVVFGRPLLKHNNFNLFEGIYKPTSQRILLKHYLFPTLPNLTTTLKDNFCLAKLHHACFFQMIDMMLTEKEEGFELVICVERGEKDLQREIKERERRGEGYGEGELWRFVGVIVEAMAYAQGLVSAI
jgi:hypothetical protein